MSQVPISSIVDVQISLETQGVTQAGFGTPMILTDEDTGWSERARRYSTITEVLDDFASSTETYDAAVAIFSQSPHVSEIVIGSEDARVAQIQTIVFSGALITGNSVACIIDGVALTATPFNTTNAQTLTDLAAKIQATAGVATAASNGTDTITVTSAIAGVPTSISGVIVTGGASQATATITTTTANHGPAEDLAEISEEDNDWYGLIWIERGEELVLECARYIETVRKIFITCSQDADILDDTDTDDIAYVLNAANYNRTAVIYNADATDFADAAWMGNCFTFEPGQENWMFKTLVSITPDTDLTTSERDAAKDKKANVYVTAGGRDITMYGTMASGRFIDQTRGADWIQARIEERVFDRLADLPKIPFTDAGIAIIINEIAGVLENGIRVGLISGEPLEDNARDDMRAYRITAPRAVDVASNDRAERLLPDVEFICRLAGAINKVIINGTVTI